MSRRCCSTASPTPSATAGSTFPPVVLWRFRIASLAVQAVTWATLAIGFGFLATRVLERDSQQARDPVAVG